MNKYFLPLAGIFLASFSAQANLVNVNELNQLLQKENLPWKAKDNAINHFSKKNAIRFLGYNRGEKSDFVVTPISPSLTINSQSEMDWRNYQGQNWVSPILDQGNCGSCVAFAAVGVLETQMNISRKAPWLNPEYSAEALFACGGGTCNGGWDPSGALNELRSEGVPDAACDPNTMGITGKDAPCSNRCSDYASRSQKISQSSAPQGIEAIKSALLRGPVMAGLDVYDDFAVYSSGIYKHRTGNYLGGHEVSIVGYNDRGRYWIVRNSWGKEWGEDGFIRISYDDTSGIASETNAIAVSNSEGAVAFRSLRDFGYITGSTNMGVVSSFPNTSEIALSIGDVNGSQVFSGKCMGSSCDIPFQSATVPNGVYQGKLLAKHGGKVSSSEVKNFYVINGTAGNLRISFQPAKGVDIRKPVKDRIEFAIDASWPAVPFSTIELRVHQGGKIISTRTSHLIAKKMVMGWRTPSVPNGSYILDFRGLVEADGYKAEAFSNQIQVRVQN